MFKIYIFGRHEFHSTFYGTFRQPELNIAHKQDETSRYSLVYGIPTEKQDSVCDCAATACYYRYPKNR